MNLDGKQLMVDDWVYALVEGESVGEVAERIPARVVKTYRDDFSVELSRFPKTIDLEDGDMFECEPIPLTPEILEKNGFKWLVTDSKSTTYCINEPTIHVSKIKENEEWLICVGATGSTRKRFVEVSCVKYFHELQHALKLCGIEKEIVL